MKFIRWLIVLVLLGGYFFWPYHATRKFAAAVEAKDAQTIKAMVDFDEHRQGERHWSDKHAHLTRMRSALC